MTAFGVVKHFYVVKHICPCLSTAFVLLSSDFLFLQVAEFLVRLPPGDTDFVDIRVAVVGNVDAGKRSVSNPILSNRITFFSLK